MKTLLKGISVLVFLSGGVWFLQGINILPGSFMTGDPQWAINGVIAMGIGLGLYLLLSRRR
ncbi:MAG: hypothetical protein FJZ87_13075 [Chloroflexi bacterium]|nr:hypothetical protein [Chloroflexota bacterium]